MFGHQLEYVGGPSRFRGHCECGQWKSFESANRPAIGRAHEKHLETLPQPFCIVSFDGAMLDRSMTGSTMMIGYIAALRFEANPDQCEGCIEFSKNIDKMGGRTR